MINILAFRPDAIYARFHERGFEWSMWMWTIMGQVFTREVFTDAEAIPWAEGASP